MFRLFVITTFILFAIYSFQGIKRLTTKKVLRIFYCALVSLAGLYFTFVIAIDIREFLDDTKNLVRFAMFFTFYIFLMVMSFILFLEDIGRFSSTFLKKKYKKMPSRRKFISKLALGLAAIPFGGLIYSVFLGRYNFKVFDYDLYFDDLPASFHNYKIVHISDFHCGGLDNRSKVEYAMNLINEQKGDVILFTGDFIDAKSSEILEWKSMFSSLRAKDGKYSILGNHDYGHYFEWNNDQEKDADFELLKDLQKEMGFDLLLNENRFITRGEQRLGLIGVEYWGNSIPVDKGDLENAIKGINDDDFKILLTHDPDHWRYIVLPHSQNIQLTLAGHTHGFQFGIEIPGKFQWTPIRSPFKYWAGIYQELGQYLNVNRGFGYAGFPGRVGIWPEVSAITLKKK